jgi:N-acetylglucosamine kinase-like BadF-type ATPase
MRADELVLGIDGGTARTVAWLSLRLGGDAPLGCGLAGPANPHAVGFDRAREHLERAVDEAFASARIKRATVSAACAAIAGVGREVDRRPFERWAEQRRLARRFVLTHDAQPVLAAGTPHGWGIALIAGAGSFAYGRSPKGRSGRVGGWGHLVGDEGSLYSIGLAALRAVIRAEDGRGEPTRLTALLLGRLSLDGVADLAPALYSGRVDRSKIAELASAALDAAAEGDPAAAAVVDEATDQLAEMTQTLVIRLSLPVACFPLALTGAALLHGNDIQRRLGAALAARRLAPDPVSAAADPVAGAVMIARTEAQA